MAQKRVDTMTHQSFKFPGLWRAIGWLLVALVVIFSLLPRPPEVLEIPSGDKVSHLVAYLILMFWFSQLYRQRSQQIWFAAGLTALGVGLELIQGLMGSRTCQFSDMIANSCGVTIGWGLTKTTLGNSLGYLETKLLRFVRGY